MGIGQEQRFICFQLLFCQETYIYTLKVVKQYKRPWQNWKRGMALGTGLGVNISNPMESKQSTGGTAATVPFMMTSDKSVNFSTDTIVNESIKKVKDTIKQNNKEILQKLKE